MRMADPVGDIIGDCRAFTALQRDLRERREPLERPADLEDRPRRRVAAQPDHSAECSRRSERYVRIPAADGWTAQQAAWIGSPLCQGSVMEKTDRLPDRPLNSWEPRSSKVNELPSSRSWTVPETRISPGCPSVRIRAAACTAIPLTSPAETSTSPVWM